jgi:hypothetical protein
LPEGSPKSLERQVDLVFAILTERADAPQAEAPSGASAPAVPRAETVVYAWGGGDEALPEASRLKQLEIENLHLKQLVGSLSLEKKVLLERLSRGESAPVGCTGET